MRGPDVLGFAVRIHASTLRTGVKHIDHRERLPCDLKLMQESFAVSNWAACIRKDGTGPIVLRQALALDI